MNEIPALITEVGRYLQRFDGSNIARVLSGIGEWRDGTPGRVKPQWLPACGHLDAALAEVDVAPLAEAIRNAMPLLHWVTYDACPRQEIGARFADGHAFASIIGEQAPVTAVDFDLGLFVIAPHVLYRDHNHAAPELYAPLTGPHGWRFKPGDPFVSKPAHAPVWNEPFAPHATLVGGTPFLAIFCWTSDVDQPAKVIPSADWGQYEI